MGIVRVSLQISSPSRLDYGASRRRRRGGATHAVDQTHHGGASRRRRNEEPSTRWPSSERKQLRRDSNPQPPDSKSDTLSIAPRSLRKEGRGRGTLLARAEAAEVLGRLGHDVRAERHLDAPRRLAADGHVEEDLCVFWRSAVATDFLHVWVCGARCAAARARAICGTSLGCSDSRARARYAEPDSPS